MSGTEGENRANAALKGRFISSLFALERRIALIEPALLCFCSAMIHFVSLSLFLCFILPYAHVFSLLFTVQSFTSDLASFAMYLDVMPPVSPLSPGRGLKLVLGVQQSVLMAWNMFRGCMVG